MIATHPGVERGTVSDTFAMELGGFPQADADERFASEAVVDPRAGVPLYVSDGSCAAAVGLQAHAEGNAMTIQYWVTDALRQVDAGHINLQRASGTP